MQRIVLVSTCRAAVLGAICAAFAIGAIGLRAPKLSAQVSAGGKIAFVSSANGNHDIAVINSDGTGLEILTGASVDNEDAPAWSPDGSRILFESDRGGTTHLYVMHADGTGVVQLNAGAWNDHSARWSPDGRHIAFTSTRNGGAAIFRMNANGTDAVQLTDGQSTDSGADWSPDGQRIAFARNDGTTSHLFVMNADGSNLSAVTNDLALPSGSSPHDDYQPRWSADGASIFFYSGAAGAHDIYAIHPDGSGASRVTSGAGDFITESVSPDGGQLAFSLSDTICTINTDGAQSNCLTGVLGDSPDWQPTSANALLFTRDGGVFRMAADGSHQRSLAASGNQATWSPSRRRIAFVSDRTGYNDVFVMSADGSTQINLTNSTSSQNFAPSWSPDGSHIVFESTAVGGQPQVFVMDAGGANAHSLSDGSGADGQPAWSPAGDRIAFASDRTGAGQLWVMNADGTSAAPLTVGDGGASAPAWSPDGRRIVYQQPVGGSLELFIIDAVNLDGSVNTNGTGAILRLTDNAFDEDEPTWSPDGSSIAFRTNRDGDFEIDAIQIDGSGEVNRTNSHATSDSTPDWGLRFFTVSPTVVTWNNPPDIVYGTTLDATQLNATAVPETPPAYDPPNGTRLNAGPGQTLSVWFPPLDLAHYPGFATVLINVLAPPPPPPPPTSIAGRVTDAPSGQGLGNVRVQAYTLAGVAAGDSTTTGTGEYAIAGLPDGFYRLRTFNDVSHIDQLYSTISCSPACDINTGGTVQVTAGIAATVNFALAPGSVIRGRVTDMAGAGIPNVGVRASDAGGFDVAIAEALTDADGYYSMPPVRRGTFYVRTLNHDSYRDELWDDLPCLGGCEPIQGRPVHTVPGTPVDVNFDLVRLGSFSGRVFENGTGAPIAASVLIFDPVSGFVSISETRPDGSYSTTGLPPGDYYAAAVNSVGYIDQVYHDLECVALYCNVDPDPIHVESGVLTDINFALNRGGQVTGTVRDGSTQQPLARVAVDILDEHGEYVTDATTNAAGAFATTGLPTGTYYARTVNQDGYKDQLFGAGLCIAGQCDYQLGTPLLVSPPNTYEHVDFELVKGAQITGFVVDHSDGDAPLSNITVQLFDDAGQPYGETWTGVDGRFGSTGLATGTYFASTWNNRGFVDQLFDGKECPAGQCSTVNGTAIELTDPNVRPDVNFALTPGGAIAGRVTASGMPVKDANIGVFSIAPPPAGPQFVAGTRTDRDGRYTIAGLLPGPYMVGSFYNGDFVNQLFNGVPCPGYCDLLTGLQLAVSVGATQTADFVLEPGGRIGGHVDAAGVALEDVTVQVFAQDGRYIGASFTDGQGNYQTLPLAPGEYLVRTATNLGYEDQSRTITVAAGPPYAVASFTLGVGHPRVSGFVFNAETNRPLANVPVTVYNTGAAVVGAGQSDAGGTFDITVPAAGTYYVRASAVDSFGDQLFRDISCAIGCDVTNGTAISVSATGLSSPQVFIQMKRKVEVRGTVTANGQPLNNVAVGLYNPQGFKVTQAFTGPSGEYAFPDLPRQTFYARTLNAIGLEDQLFDGLRCAIGCDVRTGAAISTAAVVPPVNFALSLDNTQPGFAVTVRPFASDGPLNVADRVTITFSEVTSPVRTTVTTSTTGSPLPFGFRLGTPPFYFDVVTGAGVTAPFTICINYAGTTFVDPANVRVLHDLGAGFVDEGTTFNNPAAQTACLTTNSLSPFVLAEAVAPPPTITVTSPNEPIYQAGDQITAHFDCGTAARCVAVPSANEGPLVDGQPIDTNTTGPKAYTITAFDADDNPVAYRFVLYFVSEAGCRAKPDGMTAWLTADGRLTDNISGTEADWNGGASHYTPGKVLEAFAFGRDAFVSLPSFQWAGSFTLQAWVSTPTRDDHEFTGLIATGTNADVATSFQIDLDGTGNYRLLAGDGPSAVSAVIGPATPYFQHIAVTFDGNQLTTYLNGQPGQSVPWFGSPGLGFHELTVGTDRSRSWPFNGAVDEVQVFDHALTPDEVYGSFAAGAAGFCKNRAPSASAFADPFTEATGPDGAVVTLDGSGSSDPDDGDTLALTYIWRDVDTDTVVGSTKIAQPVLRIGAHTIELTVNDGHGGTASTRVYPEVRDTRGPIWLSGPPFIYPVPTIDANGVDATWDTPVARDDVDGLRPVECVPPSGSHFAFNSFTWITCSASDTSGHAAIDYQFYVYVYDASPPVATILVPAQDGLIYTLNQDVRLDYDCSDSVGITNCLAYVDGQLTAKGDPINTWSGGPHSIYLAVSDGTYWVYPTRSYVIQEPPVITVNSPREPIYELGETVVADFDCPTALSCDGTYLVNGQPNGQLLVKAQPIDTLAPGEKSFKITAADQLGQESEWYGRYTVSTGTPFEPPLGMTVWLPGDGDSLDTIGGREASWAAAPLFSDGKVLQGFNIGNGRSLTLAPLDQPGAFTLQAWVSTHPSYRWLPESTGILSTGLNALDPTSFQLELDGYGNYQLRLGAEGSPDQVILPIGPAMDFFQHLAVTFDGDYLQVYLNGQPVLFEPLDRSGGPDSLGFHGLKIGTDRSGTREFVGTVDEVQVFNRALFIDEINGAFSAGKKGVRKNKPPVPSVTVSGTEATSAAGSTITLDARATNDPENDTLVFTWRQNGVEFATGDFIQRPLAIDHYDFTLTVDDGHFHPVTIPVPVDVADTTKPYWVTWPGDVTGEASEPTRGPATWNPPTAADLVDRSVRVECSAAPGDFFLLDVPTTVNCSATDDYNNHDDRSFTVTVRDTVGPDVTVTRAPGDVEAIGPLGAPVTFSATALDVVSGDRPVECKTELGTIVSSGSTFPLGLTHVTCTALDAAGNPGYKPFDVMVLDRIAPFVRIVSPTADAFVTGPYREVVMEASDAVGVASVYVNGFRADLIEGSAQFGKWAAQVFVGYGPPVSAVPFNATAFDAAPASNPGFGSLIVDNDGIPAALDRNLGTGNDESSVFSNSYVVGPTSGSIISRANWTVKLCTAASDPINCRAVPANTVRASVSGVGAGTIARIGACPGAAKEIRLDQPGETADIRCEGTTVWVKPLSAQPTIDVLKQLPNGLWSRAQLPTGYLFSTGSPATAGADNPGPIDVDLLQMDEAGELKVVGHFQLPPDASVDLTAPSADRIQFRLIRGGVTATVSGRTQLLRPGTTTMTIDRTPPRIRIDRPIERATYTLGESHRAAYQCTDEGAGVAACVGTANAGGAIATDVVGDALFTVSATDRAGNADERVVPYRVTYGVERVADQGRAAFTARAPIAVRLVDGAGANRSSADVPLSVQWVREGGRALDGLDAMFEFDEAGRAYRLAGGAARLPPGLYTVGFTAAGDSVEHAIEFQVR